MGLEAIFLFGFETLLIGLSAKRYFLLDKKGFSMEQTNGKSNGYNDSWSLDGLSCRPCERGGRYFSPKDTKRPLS